MITMPVTTSWNVYSAEEFFNLVVNSDYGINAIRIYNRTVTDVNNNPDILLKEVTGTIGYGSVYYKFDDNTIGFRYSPVNYSYSREEFIKHRINFTDSLGQAGNDCFAVRIKTA